MSLNMSIRIIIKIFLAIQLMLLVFRQLIDFAGIQWLMIIINAVAIIVTITAFFGHLRLYASFQVFIILYNVFVILIYARFISLPGFAHSNEDFVSSTDNSIRSLSNDKTFYHHADFPTATRTSLPSTQLLSFDANSRSFWYVIVSNHVSELHATIVSSPVLPNTFPSSAQNSADRRHQPSFVDESLVDLCVQYIEIAIACLHIFFSLLGIGLILLKYKLQRDKLFRNNDKTTPPLPPYTISPQMNHYMSYTPSHPFNPPSSKKNGSKNGSIYTTNSTSMRRSKRHRRSTRSLHNSKSKANSMGALNIRTSTGSLRSMSKQAHRKSATSLLMNDTSFSNNTIGSRGGTSGRSSKGMYQAMPPPPPPPSNNGYGTSRSSGYGVLSSGSSSQQHAAKFLTSDSETDYYHTFTPNYVNNGLNNPLYGNRHSYMNDSETAI